MKKKKWRIKIIGKKNEGKLESGNQKRKEDSNKREINEKKEKKQVMWK